MYNSPSLQSLPVEIFYRILDHIDGETILLSFRKVCKKFKAITNTYNRYELDFSSMSKTDFDFACRAIRPEDVISLTLSNGDHTPDQINQFFSLFTIDRLIRLRSLTLLHVYNKNTDELQTILNQILTVCPLTSFSIQSKYGDKMQLQPLLSSIITQSTLRRLDFGIYYFKIDKIPWPANCLLEYLKIGTCTFQQFCAILDHSPNLRTLVLRNCSEIHIGLPIIKTYPQLTSLTFDDLSGYIYMYVLEPILSRTPSLIHLKIVSIDDGCSLSDGAQWEKFIQTKLLYLKKFEFFFGRLPGYFDDSPEMKSLVSFQTSFWRETQRMIVAYAHLKHIRRIVVCSLPVCLTSFSYHYHYQGKPTDDPKTMTSTDDGQWMYSTKPTTENEVCLGLTSCFDRHRFRCRMTPFNICLTI